MGKIVSKIDIKAEPKKSKKTFIIISVALLLMVIFITTIVLKSQLPKADTAASKITEENREEIKAQAEDIANFIEIMKNQNVVLNVTPGSKYAYPGIPSQLNEYPIYKTCDGRVMPNNVNPFGSYSWAMLAYASLYDFTGDTNYITSIRATEDKLTLLFKEFEVRRTAVMFHPLYLSYLLLEGKGVLKNESAVIDMILSDTQWFIDKDLIQYLDTERYVYVQDTAMMSVAFDDAAIILNELGENKDEVDRYIGIAEQINKKAIDLSKSSAGDEPIMCWLLWSDYHLRKAKGEDISDIESQLLSKTFTDELLKKEIPTANTFHPCMEVMLDIYSQTKNFKLLELFNDYGQYYAHDLSGGKEECIWQTSYAIKNGYHKNTFYLSDNAYQIYLISRPQLKMMVQK